MKENSINRLNEHGYTCKHLIGKWYLVRHWSNKFTKFSWYDLTTF